MQQDRIRSDFIAVQLSILHRKGVNSLQTFYILLLGLTSNYYTSNQPEPASLWYVSIQSADILMQSKDLRFQSIVLSRRRLDALPAFSLIKRLFVLRSASRCRILSSSSHLEPSLRPAPL